MAADPEASPLEWPREWEADVVLLDGRPARLRPIQPSDADRLRAFYDRVSERSKYLRFFAPYPTLSSRDVERFTSVDHDRRVGLVATSGDDIIGIGRYEAVDERQAEISFLVEDAHQGRGLVSCSSSTSPKRRGSAGCSGSSPTCCPATTGCCRCSTTRATG